MIIENIDQLTQAVLAETQRAADPRTREILQSMIRHLHAFVREVSLTEKEFDEAISYITRLGQLTTESHNEVRLLMGTLGVSTLVCLLNNGPNAATKTSANLLGPFWRKDSPRTENGGSLLRSPTPGPALFFKGWVRDAEGRSVEGAEVDVWHASPVGLYENQDPEQAEMNLRGKFTTDANGEFSFRSIKPAGYPIPTNGPVGALLRAQGRHNYRPAHLHFLIYKTGYKTITSQIYSPDDPHLHTDAQFGVTRALVGSYQLHQNEPLPDATTDRTSTKEAPASGASAKEDWYSLQHTFILQPGESWLPTPPVSAKATSPAPAAATKG